jgi:hypothetical protein
MWRAGLVIVALLACAGAGGCGESADRPAPTPSATPRAGKYPVAYAIAREDVAKLARAKSSAVLDNQPVVASSEWKPYPLLVLTEWLRERGIKLDPPREFDEAVTRIGTRWDASVVLVTVEHKRRYQRRLQRLKVDRDELRDYYNDFNEESWPEAGTAMADWLRIVKASIAATNPRRSVVIPVED